jgi:hypothetical protein
VSLRFQRPLLPALRPPSATLTPPPARLHTRTLLASQPYQYHMYQEGLHLTKGRFFPLEYIKQLLALGERVDVTMQTSVEEIVAKFESRVSYEDMHSDCYERCGSSHRALANWQAEDFLGSIEGDSVVGSELPRAKLVEADKQTLQMYGRAYTAEGKPTGTYYKFARSERLPEFGGATE